MKAKKFLGQIEKIDLMVQNKLIEIERLRSVAMGISSHSIGEKVQSSPNQAKMSDAVAKIVDLESEANGYIDRLIDTTKEVIAVIEQLNPIEYDVMHKRYIQNMAFKEISISRGKSDSWATTIHGRALKNVQRILDERERHE